MAKAEAEHGHSGPHKSPMTPEEKKELEAEQAKTAKE